MKSEDVTLAIPCYNTEKTLPRVLWHVDYLDPAPERIICVDDASTDGTADIVARRDGVDLLRHEENRGIAAAMNTALEQTTTPWLAKVDADVLVESDWLGTLCESATEYDSDHLAGRAREVVGTLGDRWRARHVTIDYFGNEPRANHWRMNGSNLLSRVEALRDVGGWDEQYRVAFDDIDLNRRLLRAGYDLYYDPSARAEHIRTDTWREALHKAWEYNNRVRRPKPDDIVEMIERIPMHMAVAAFYLGVDVKNRDFETAWISALGVPFGLKWDLEAINGNQ